ncbi:uncharacterized protein [Nicotiana tomentosiformis]|uniref:uncharacterized protein n=1 Tax=Nicotiana tomentosiformis TaxID=4098 RepID=UPI00388CC0E3
MVDYVYWCCVVTIGGYKTRANFILLNMVDFDVILGMDWLSPYHAILDYRTKTVTLSMPELPRLEWIGSLSHVPSRIISYFKAQRMVEKGCLAYLSFVRDVSADTPIIESVPVLREFSNMFPVALPSMPPNMDIDLVPCTQPISIPSYRMALVELKELRNSYKSFIRPSVSPWGALVLFVNKNDVYMRMCIDYNS